MQALRNWLLRLLLPKRLEVSLAESLPHVWDFYGTSEQRWKVGRYQVTNWRFADVFRELSDDLNERRALLAKHSKAAERLSQDVAALESVQLIARTLDGGLGI